MPADPYSSITRLYDLENAAFTEDIDAYLRLAAPSDPQPALDVGCGTGRVSIPLAMNGIPITAVDPSQAMLNRGRERAEAMGVAGITWHHSEIGSISLPDRFALVFFANGGFQHLLTPQEQRVGLTSMLQHAQPGGVIALDIPNAIPYIQGEDPPGFAVERILTDEDGTTVIMQTITRTDRATQLLDVTYIYDHQSTDGLVRRELTTMHLRLTFAPELMLLLELAARHAGVTLGEVELYGDYDFSPYEEDSPRLFAVVRMPA